MDGMYAGFAGAKTGHDCPALGWRLVLVSIWCFDLFTFTTFCGCDLSTVFTIGGKHAMEACQVITRTPISQAISTQLREVEIRTFADAGVPALGYRFDAGIEAYAFRAVDMVITEQ